MMKGCGKKKDKLLTTVCLVIGNVLHTQPCYRPSSAFVEFDGLAEMVTDKHPFLESK